MTTAIPLIAIWLHWHTVKKTTRYASQCSLSKEYLFNGQLPAGGIPRINTLIWKGFNIRIDLYESFIGLNVEEFNNGHEQIKEFMLIAKRIIALIELKGEKEKIAQLAEEGSLALHQVTLLPRDSQKKSIFKGVDITFMDKDEVWKV